MHRLTRDAIQGAVWRASVDLTSDVDAVTEVRAMRSEDNTIADAAEQRSAQRGTEADGGVDAVGLELLRHVGVAPES